jgi:hypothetical protein
VLALPDAISDARVLNGIISVCIMHASATSRPDYESILRYNSRHSLSAVPIHVTWGNISGITAILSQLSDTALSVVLRYCHSSLIQLCQ